MRKSFMLSKYRVFGACGFVILMRLPQRIYRTKMYNALPSILINAPMNNEKSSAIWLLSATACTLPEISIINRVCSVSIPALISVYVKHTIVHKWNAFELFAMPYESICDFTVFYIRTTTKTRV